MLANKILENFPACSRLLKPAQLFFFWKFSCLLVYYILLVYSRSNFVNKSNTYCKGWLRKVVWFVKNLAKKYFFLMNFCNVSLLNYLKINNFYCTEVRCYNLTTIWELKSLSFWRNFLPACLLEPAWLLILHGFSSLLVYYSLLVYLNFMEFPACLFIRACSIITDTREVRASE